jgi:4'-phosphopantetheinyl transferase
VSRDGAAELGPDSIHLWYAFSDESGPADSHERLLSDDERQRQERLLLPDARHRFAVAHALLRSALSEYAAVEPMEWRFSKGPHGKPEIADPTGVPPLRFNLSHTAGLSACAVTLGRDIGVDVEMTGRRTSRRGIARRFFAPEEAAAVEARPELFFDYWTLKESLIKARGRGLSMGLSRIAFRLGDGGEASLAAGPSGWRFFSDAPSDRHVCAVAVRAPAGEPLELTILRYARPRN